MNLKPWHTIISPREDLREGKPLDASEFAVNLDHVRSGKAGEDYTNPERFFHRTYLTESLLDLAAQTIRRWNGITVETSPIFNLSTQFGGGKTHSLTLLYHLALGGEKANKWTGVDRILKKAEVTSIPTAKTAIFVGTEFSSMNGRGNIGEPIRFTPWGEIAFQIGGKEGFALLEKNDKEFIAPSGDDLEKLFDPTTSYLILFDEIINYVSKYRNHNNLGSQFYQFLHTLSEFVRSRKNIVLTVAIPSSELEMTPEDVSDFDRIKKLLDRLGKAMFLSSGKETNEIIRRRLFEWNLLPEEAKKQFPNTFHGCKIMRVICLVGSLFKMLRKILKQPIHFILQLYHCLKENGSLCHVSNRQEAYYDYLRFGLLSPIQKHIRKI